MKLGHCSIGSRLAAAIGIVVLLSVASTGLAFRQLTLVERQLENTVFDHKLSNRLSHDMAASVHVGSSALSSLVLLSDKADLQAQELRLLQARRQYEASWAALQSRASSGSGQVHREAIEAAARQAQGLDKRVIELARAGHRAEATALLTRSAGPATQAWQDALDKHTASQEADTEQQQRQAAAGLEQAQAALIAAQALAIVLLAFLGWLTLRSITRHARGAAVSHLKGDGVAGVRFEGAERGELTQDASKPLGTVSGGPREERVVGTVSGGGSSRLVADIVSVVDGMTLQANIIALNAAEGAARATGQLGWPVDQMHLVAQRNAALAHECAAAAASIKSQANQLVQAVALFRLGAGAASPVAAALEVAPPAPAPLVLAEGPVPERASNVSRPRFGARTAPALKPAPPAPLAPAEPPPVRAAAMTGTDRWASF